MTKYNEKKAILVVSFGTSYEDTRKITLDAIEEKIKKEFNQYEVRKAYTSNMIRKILEKRDNIHIDSTEDALNRLYKDGYKEIIIIPLHVIPGIEYDKIIEVVKRFSNKNLFSKLILGKPILYKTDDYEVVIDALKNEFLKFKDNKALILMGHGTEHPSTACYALLDYMLKNNGYKNIYVATVEGMPTLDNVIERLKKEDVKEVTLKPFMVVSGDHAKNDMAGNEEDSWNTILRKYGFKVNIDMSALGENENIRNIYINNVYDCIEGKLNKK